MTSLARFLSSGEGREVLVTISLPRGVCEYVLAPSKLVPAGMYGRGKVRRGGNLSSPSQLDQAWRSSVGRFTAWLIP